MKISQNKIEKLIKELCPDGVKYRNLVDLCKIETGKLNANSAESNGKYMFFTTAVTPSRINKYRWDTEALLVAGNANVGDVKHYIGKFEAYQRTYVLTDFSKDINVRFLYFVLSSYLKEYLVSRSNKAAMTYIVLSTLENFRIPLPPLDIQKEIVKILNEFTELEAELEAELECRKEQYEHYSNKLLSFSDKVEWKELGELMSIVRGASPRPISAYLSSDEDGVSWIKIGDVEPNAKYITSTAQKIKKEGVSKSRLLKKGDFVLSNSMSFGRPYILGIDGCIHDGWIAMSDFTKTFTPDFLYHLLRSKLVQNYWKQKASTGTVQNLNIDIVKSTKVPVPSLEVQKEKVSILDKFDSLVNDISIGLPAELNARRKQYEYYRNKLLTFKEKK